MLELINAERGNVGAQPLAFDSTLNTAAETHSMWMLNTDTFSHTGAGSSDAGQRMTAAGYVFAGSWAWGENIAWASTRAPAGTQDEVQLLHTNLMNSTGHRENILNANYREIGIGFEIGAFQNYEAAMVTQDFGRTAGNPMLVGVAFDDKDGDRLYDMGEGLANADVMIINTATGATTTVHTEAAGGYQLELAAGTYSVTFSEDGLTPTTSTITIGGNNVKLDWIDPAPAVGTPAINNTLSGDFNGDGRNDVVWRNDNGALTNWLGQGSGGFVSNDANAWASVPTSWHTVGAGDFNGDGRDDLVWRNDDGSFTEWLGQASGGFVSNDAHAWANVPTSWHVVDTGDFNGDGRSDVIWRNDSGAFTEWLGQANGGFVSNDAHAWADVPTSWHAVGTGDFNGDGRDDIIWRNDNGAFTEWLGKTDGGFVSNDAKAWASVPTNWHVVGTGDFNGDGRSDVIWRNDNGTFTEWLGQASGGFASNDAKAWNSLPNSWQVAGTGDFNGDGRDDVIWRNDSGAFTEWLGQASGGFVSNDANAWANVPTIWQVASNFIV